MVLLLFVFINIVVAVYAIRYKKTGLDPLEIFAYWCFTVILIQNNSALLHLNIEGIILSERESYNWADLLNRLIFLPIFFVWFINRYVRTANRKEKAILFFLSLNIVVGIEWFGDWVGLYEHKHWEIWWSYLSKGTMLLLALIFMKIFRHYYYKRDKANEFYV
ncbi:putative membrane protein SirB2 [Salirhabdus euzebyi]|uniref:Putative membrane protein SirB2 n=1 Tax=Salirhabdus euzebyi TaxID=394506 RepID=A0A841Q201_9BACI|nr:hypothetical protein [Salirhabdus euzebyi]MBB6452362.1 putative membrane protein SirB2 [Salirhabdus euzebyi]